MEHLYQKLSINPIIAAVKDEAVLEQALTSGCEAVFLLAGDICTIRQTVGKIQAAGKTAYIHIDLMEGFGRDKSAVRYIKEYIGPDGIITTRAPLAKMARELELPVIQRLFLVDNLSVETGIQSVRQVHPDAVEIMPGLMPEVIKRLCAAVPAPIIAGGLIARKEHIIAALGAGAVGVSTSQKDLWQM